jgi:hypothetical protein
MIRLVLAPSFRRFTGRLLVATGCFAVVIAPPAAAATVSWDGDTSSAWASGSNWVGGTPPSNDTTSDLAAFVFGSLPSFQPNAGTTSIAGIVIGDGSTLVPAFGIAGTSLTIGGSGIAQLAASGSTTISSPTVLAAAQRIARSMAPPHRSSG